MADNLNRAGSAAAVLNVGQEGSGTALSRMASNRGLGVNAFGFSLGAGAVVSTVRSTPDVQFNFLFTVDSVCVFCSFIPGNVTTNFNFFQSGFLGGGENSPVGLSSSTQISNNPIFIPSNVNHFNILNPAKTPVPSTITTIITGNQFSQTFR